MSIDISKIVKQADATYALPHCPKGINIFVIGAGGTGSYLLPNLLRLTKFGKVFPNIKVTVIDGDVVEDKNLARQNFHAKYLNRNKAQALSETWSSFVGYPVAYIDRYLEDMEDMKKVFFPSTGELPIVVGCVDSMQCRAEINKLFKDKNTSRMVWIDSGNEEFFGQTIVSDNFDKRLHTMVDIAPDLFLPENLVKTSEISCAEHAEENIQNISANIQAANNLFMVLNTLLSGDSIEYSMLTFNTKTMVNTRTEIFN